MAELKDIKAATVNGRDIDLNELLYGMKIANALGNLDSAVREVMVLDAIKQHGIEVSDDELQKNADELRRNMGLTRASDTIEWLGRNQLRIEDFETYVWRRVATLQLKEKIAADQVDSYFREHSSSFDSVRLAQIIVESEELAREMADKLKNGADFAAMARQHSIDAETREGGGYLDWMGRAALPPPIASAVFAGKPGDVVGPVLTDRGYHLLKVEDMQRAELNEKTKPAVREALFADWLEQEVSKSKAEFRLPAMVTRP